MSREFRNFLATDRVPETLFGVPVVADKEEYTEDDIRFFMRNPEAGGYYDLGRGGALSQGDMDGGDADDYRYIDDRPSFLASDDVPETLFGVPVVASPESYTEADVRFFEEHPEAGGYYDLGAGTPDDGTAEGAPVQADEPPKFDRRGFSMSFEQALKKTKETRPDGTEVTYVHPQPDKDGQWTAGGYNYYKGHSTGALTKHKDGGRITWDQWADGADMMDAIFTGQSSETADGLGIPRGSAGEDVLWDLAFNLKNYKDWLSRKGSPNLYAKADRLKAAFPRSYGTVALLLESASYGKNDRRNIARGEHILDGMRRSSDPDERFVAGTFDRIYKSTKEPKTGTKGRRSLARHKAALEALEKTLMRSADMVQ